MKYKQAQLDSLGGKPPETREFIRGDKKVTQEWDGRQWHDVAEGLAFKPTPDTVINNSLGAEPADGQLRKELQGAEGKSWSAIKDTAVTSANTAQDLQVVDELLAWPRKVQSLVGWLKLSPAFRRLVLPWIQSSSDWLQPCGFRVLAQHPTLNMKACCAAIPPSATSPKANRLISQIMKSKAQINLDRGAIVDAYSNNEITASDARRKMMALDKKSILTPEMRQLLMGVAPGTGKSDIDERLKRYN